MNLTIFILQLYLAEKTLLIDLRSDTVTKPSPDMLTAMQSAATGDDVYGEDPTVNELEQLAAQITGKQAALYCVSGTQSNLLAMLSHCERGQEFIAGQEAHAYKYEGGGAAALGGIQPYTLPFNERGELAIDDIRASIKPDDMHFAVTRLLCLENTQAGQVLSLDYLRAFSQLAQQYQLKRHMDGARGFNAAVKLGVPIQTICEHFDTISLCLSKGLACPVGSLLVGDEATINKARRYRKMIGGGMRQAGVIAAAGIYALRNNINRLQQDHDNAQLISESVGQLEHLGLAQPTHTNMVMISRQTDLTKLTAFLADRHICISGTRWVLHRDISRSDVEAIIDACEAYNRLF